MKSKTKKTIQLNVRIDQATRDQIEEIRHAGLAVPSAGEVVRAAVALYHARVFAGEHVAPPQAKPSRVMAPGRVMDRLRDA